MKWVIGIGGLWLVIIICLIIYSHSPHSSTSLKSPQQHDISSDQIQKGGPVVGDEIKKEETPGQVITRYLQYINDGDIDNAASLVEPNKLLEYTSNQKGLSAHAAVEKYVTLFPKKTAANLEITGTNISETEANINVNVKFNSLQTKSFSFTLKLLVEDDGHQKEQFWLITKQAEANQEIDPGFSKIPDVNTGKVDQSKIVQPNSPLDKVDLFLTLINEGKLDGAAALFDPNILMVAISNQKDKDSRQVMESFVQIFRPGDMVSYTSTPIDSKSTNEKSFKVQLKMKKGGDQIYTVLLDNIINDATTGKSSWYIKSVVRQP
ncbi:MULTISPECIES: hypothetical protein [unclassified Paenibacillus]|uniref:hypothetical protein n=1 Tax=unclassified Paenibacillus TaxID=185978 RepID=UPI0027891153|nr:MULTISPECIES: hypothetical protein [unclassified Paenibacillus]MDQ0896339.1 hypothetical protein [Paenibacillus sp. V4I7]MDQ0914118.1 hypothetical protein [Paenibacillus sp. V4I5]